MDAACGGVFGTCGYFVVGLCGIELSDGYPCVGGLGAVKDGINKAALGGGEDKVFVLARLNGSVDCTVGAYLVERLGIDVLSGTLREIGIGGLLKLGYIYNGGLAVKSAVLVKAYAVVADMLTLAKAKVNTVHSTNKTILFTDTTP